MLKIRGVNVFPSQIESVLMGFEQIAPHYQLVLTRENCADHLEVKVELSDKCSPILDNFPQLEQLRQGYTPRNENRLGIDTKITIVGHKTLQRFQGKAQRILDLRNK